MGGFTLSRKRVDSRSETRGRTQPVELLENRVLPPVVVAQVLVARLDGKVW